MQHLRTQHELTVHVEQRHQRGATAPRPRRQGRPGCVHVRACVDGLLAVVRQVIHEAADQRVCHQAGSGHAAVDDLRRDRFLHQHRAAPAGPLAANVAVHEELGRHDVQPLAHVLAHALHRLAAVGRRADGVLGLVVVDDALQVFGQCLSAGLALGFERSGWRCDGLSLQRFELRLQARLIGGQRLLEQLTLLGVHGLGAGRELPRLHPRQLERDALGLGVTELDGPVALGDLLALRGDSLALRMDLRKHLRGHFGQRRRAQTVQVLGLELRGRECVRLEHARIVKSEHWRGYPGRNGLPAPC